MTASISQFVASEDHFDRWLKQQVEHTTGVVPASLG
jgi:hypothetical protein